MEAKRQVIHDNSHLGVEHEMGDTVEQGNRAYKTQEHNSEASRMNTIISFFFVQKQADTGRMNELC
jgi:hypothetical protein